MPSSHETSQFATRLLQQDDPLNDLAYKEYRMKLENALTTAERREKFAGRLAGVSLVVGVVLMFAAGSKLIGSVDPGDPDATILSVTLGVVYWLAVVAGLFSMAAYYSRFRPRIREIKEQIRDANILALQCEIAELRKQIGATSRREDP
jgi:hypothetical protein